MRRIVTVLSALAITVSVLTGCTQITPPPALTAQASIVITDTGPQVALRTMHGDITFWSGVNLGPTVPGTNPGELAATRDDYERWLNGMHDMGVQFVRIYTILPPAFYSELDAFNAAHKDDPLWLIQGVYLPEESYLTSRNLYSPEMTDTFTAELQDAVDAVYGTLNRAEPVPGRASGVWNTDVSRWLAAWIIGAELDPEAAAESDEANPDRKTFTGEWFTTVGDSTPTEAWYAARMNDLAAAQATHGQSAPIAFINWPTTDPLAHPTEPRWQEDFLSLDANHVAATEAWTGGTFASYHAYPYYPDFLRYSPDYTAAGDGDPYVGYLKALKAHHDEAGLPTMITEVGVPSSIGSAHAGTLDRNHGGLTEQEAMQTDADLMHAIKDAGLAGALLFSWMDEWFKVTWNTQPRQSVVDGERRTLWHDPLTAEQWFGVVANDPVDVGLRVPYESRNHVRLVGVNHDESFLYLSTTLDHEPTVPVEWAFDVVPGGSPTPANPEGNTSDVFVRYNPFASTMQAYVRAKVDPARLDGLDEQDIPAPAFDDWVLETLTLNRTYPATETNPERESESFPVGEMVEGSWDPADPGYDSNATWNTTTDVNGLVTVHMRIPWSMLLIGDPSSRTAAIPNPKVKKPSSPLTPIPAVAVPVESIGLVVESEGEITPVIDVAWEQWNAVDYRERVKTGALAVANAWQSLRTNPPTPTSP